MITCQVYKEVEVLKFLEVEGISLTLNRELYSDEFREMEYYGRKFSASIRVFAVCELADAGEKEEMEMIEARGDTPNQALEILSRMLEGESRDLFKCSLDTIKDKYEMGELLKFPPLKHTEVEVIDEVVDYKVFDKDREELMNFDYSKYE